MSPGSNMRVRTTASNRARISIHQLLPQQSQCASLARSRASASAISSLRGPITDSSSARH